MYLTRHRDMISDVSLNQKIIVFGAGSIGSYTVLALTKLGYSNIVVLDDGIVEDENIAPQFYRERDIGKFKVDCLKRSIKELTGVEILAVNKRFEIGTIDALRPFLSADETTFVLTVDSMKARKFIAEMVDFTYLVDARMAIEFLAVYAFPYKFGSSGVLEWRKYQNTLFSDENAVQEACTNKAISYTSLIAGGLVAKSVLDLHKGKITQLQTINFDINFMDMVKI